MVYNKFVVQNFKNVMRNNLSKENYAILENNIRDIKIKNRWFIPKKTKFSLRTGSYDGQAITLYERKDAHTLYHELFHAASSISPNNSGFHHHEDEVFDTARGINEGYTELMTIRYFGKKDFDSEFYLNEVHYMNLIERLIGKDKMESMYFKSDLSGFINELCNYNTIDNVMKFIERMDYFIIFSMIHRDKMNSKMTTSDCNNYRKEMDEKIIETYNFINQFIINCYINKYENDINYENIMNALIENMSVTLNTTFKEFSFDVRNMANESVNSKGFK